MEERLRRFQQFLPGRTVRAKCHCKTDAGPSGKSLSVRLTVLRVKFLRCLRSAETDGHQDEATNRYSHILRILKVCYSDSNRVSSVDCLRTRPNRSLAEQG